MKNRERKRNGLNAKGGASMGGSASLAPTPTSIRALTPVRKKLASDFLHFYNELIANETMVLGRRKKQVLGAIHLLLVDFLNILIHEEVESYTDLHSLIPPIDPTTGRYVQERWIYWRDLAKEPEIQDGPNGPISQMYAEKFWQGVIVRLAGDGLIKAVVIPRGHLKSTICTQAHNLWKMCRDPKSRTLVRSLNQALAKSFIGDIKYQFEGNANFIDAYGDLGPPLKGDGVWSAEALKFICDVRMGKEPTVLALGSESDPTGLHFDRVVLDDLVGEQNFRGAAARELCVKVQRMFSVLDPGCELVDVGTPWETNDVHSLFISPKSDMGEDTSFIIATALDGDESSSCSAALTPNGYGKPIWPEKFTVQALTRIRKGMPNNRAWFSQYFSQFHGTSLKMFGRDWLQVYRDEERARIMAQKPDLFIAFDLASGQKEQKGNLDCSACTVLGQLGDQLYLLDGFKEMMTATQIVQAICDILVFWREQSDKHGCNFRAVIEKNAYTNFLDLAIKSEMARRGHASYYLPEPITTQNKDKVDRIRGLTLPMSEKRFYVPATLEKQCYGPGDPYYLHEKLREEMLEFPSMLEQPGMDDLLDSAAHAYGLSLPTEMEAKPRTDKGLYTRDKSVYSRERALREESERSNLALGGYETGGIHEWQT